MLNVGRAFCDVARIVGFFSRDFGASFVTVDDNEEGGGSCNERSSFASLSVDAATSASAESSDASLRRRRVAVPPTDVGTRI